ncbi:MAG: dethiobiotin synthase [Candidatus Omnitrophica bacterium]|nr:dethiobiotin synthase [Candidatus Omnitrophota bacterium]
MRAIFVTGTDTGVGKTVICGLLGRFLSDKGYNVITQKWVQSGSGSFPKDIDSHLKLMGLTRRDVKDYLSHISPYSYRFPASPHLSADLENKKISSARIKKSFRFLAKRFDFVIVEGSGGALVPINRKKLLIDIAKDLKLPVLVVAGNKLGAINHTLLTIEAIRVRRMKIAGVIFNDLSKKTAEMILKDNPDIVKALTGERILGRLPWMKDKDSLYEAFIPKGERIKWIAG